VTEIAFPPSSPPPLIMIISSPAKFVSFSKAAHRGYFPKVVKGEETREWGWTRERRLKTKSIDNWVGLNCLKPVCFPILPVKPPVSSFK